MEVSIIGSHVFFNARKNNLCYHTKRISHDANYIKTSVGVVLVLDIEDSYDIFITDGETKESIEQLVDDLKNFPEYDSYPGFQEIVYELEHTMLKSIQDIFSEIEEFCTNNKIDCPALGLEFQDDPDDYYGSEDDSNDNYIDDELIEPDDESDD